jgi:hypothetical protein
MSSIAMGGSRDGTGSRGARVRVSLERAVADDDELLR